jgi:hypothetical protein
LVKVTAKCRVRFRLAFGNVNITWFIASNGSLWNILAYPVPDELANFALLATLGVDAEELFQ